MSKRKPRTRTHCPSARHKAHKKDHAYVLIVSMSFALLFLLVGMAFMSSVEFSSMMAHGQDAASRADLMAKRGQAVAQMFLLEHGQNLPHGTFYTDYEEQLASFRGYDGDPSVTATPASSMTPELINNLSPIRIALQNMFPEETKNFGVPIPPQFPDDGRYSYLPSIYRARALEGSTNPSLSQEVFEDDGVWDSATEKLVGAKDNQFTFLDYGSDGLPDTSDTGEGNGLQDLGEPSERFSDVNGNGLLDAFTGGNWFGDGSFASYGIKIRDANSMIFVNGGEPANPNMKANFPFVPVFYGDCSGGYNNNFYMTRIVNLPTIKLLNNLGVILSRVPSADSQVITDHDTAPDNLWFDEQGRPRGLWVDDDNDPDTPVRPIFGPATQDPNQRGQWVDGSAVEPISQFGLGDILILASTVEENGERIRKSFTEFSQIRDILISDTRFETQMTDHHIEILREFITLYAWVDDTTVTGAKFWDPEANIPNLENAYFSDTQFMTRNHRDFFADSDIRRHDIDTSLSVPSIKPADDPARVFPSGDPLKVHRRDQGTNFRAELAFSRVFLGSRRISRESFIEYAPAGRTVTSQLGFNQIDRTFPLVPGRWDAGFDKDTELDNLFGVVPERRAPINLNTAPAAVLEAVFMGLEASYVTDAQNNLWPNRDLLKPIRSRSLSPNTPAPAQFSDAIRFEDQLGNRMLSEIELGMTRPYLYQWTEDYHVNFLPRSNAQTNANNSLVRQYQLPEWDWINDEIPANESIGYKFINSIASIGIDIAQDWYRMNPTIEMTPSVAIYPIEAHELAKAIVNYRKGHGTFADVGISGIAGDGLDRDKQLGGESNGRLDYNEDYNYTGDGPGTSIELIEATTYRHFDGPQTFANWEQFMTFLDCVKFRVFLDQINDGITMLDGSSGEIHHRLLADLKVDLIFANANPNADLLRFNPNASFASYNRRFMNPAQRAVFSYNNVGSVDGELQEDIPEAPAGTIQMVPRNIDKLDLFTPGEQWDDNGDGIFDPADNEAFHHEYEDLNGNALFDYGGFPTHTTEFIFDPCGIYHVETVGKAGPDRSQIHATKKIRSVTRLFSQKRLSSQRDFEGVPSSKDVGAYPDKDFVYDRALHSRDTERADVRGMPRLQSYPEFDPMSWTSDYQMTYDRPQSSDHIRDLTGNGLEKVWRWVRNGTSSFRVPSSKGSIDDQLVSPFYQSPAAVYDGQLALPTWEVTQNQMTGPGQNVFNWALRFYIRFNGTENALNDPFNINTVNDDLNAWYFTQDGFFGELAPKRNPTSPRPAQAFNKQISMRNTSNLDMYQKGLLEPEFWGIGTYSSTRLSMFGGGNWGLHRESKIPDPLRSETLAESQAYRHWPESIPKYDREGGLTADGMFRLGIRNLIYDLRNGPQGLGGVPGYGPASVLNQSELPSIFRKNGTSWPDDDGRNLYITMWVKPAYSGNGRRNRYSYDFAEQFIKPHRLPNPVVWALSDEGTDEVIPGGGLALPLLSQSLRYPRAYGWIEDASLDSGVGNQFGKAKFPSVWQGKEAPQDDPNNRQWVRSEYWAKSGLYVERPHLHGGLASANDPPKSYGFPVWWKQTINPIPPFPPFQSGTIQDTRTGQLTANQAKMFGPIYTAIPNMLLDMKFYWATQPWVNDSGNPDPHHPFPQFKDHESFNSIQLWSDISDPVFNHEINGMFDGVASDRFKQVLMGLARSTRVGRDPTGAALGPAWPMHMPNTPPAGAFAPVNTFGFRNDSVWGNERNPAYPHFGRPLVARLTRYVNVFKALPGEGPAQDYFIKRPYDPDEPEDQDPPIIGRFLHWAVYDPPARNLQYDTTEDFLMKKGEWVRVSYAIKEPVSSTPLHVPSVADGEKMRNGYHKIWVFGTPDDFKPDPEIFTRSNYVSSAYETVPRIYQGWWINRPQILHNSALSVGDPAVHWNYWDLTTSYNSKNWPNRSNGESGGSGGVQIFKSGFGGQDSAFFGRLEQINLGPGFAGTLDEFMILGGIGPDETVAVAGSTLESKIRSIESFGLMRDRYRRLGSYLSPVIELPSNATVTGVRWSEFIPHSLKRPWGIVSGPNSDPAADGETAVQMTLINDGQPLSSARPMEMPSPDDYFPGAFVAKDFRVRIDMQATVHEEYQRLHPVRKDRLLDTPMLDDILIVYTTGPQILFWEELN